VHFGDGYVEGETGYVDGGVGAGWEGGFGFFGGIVAASSFLCLVNITV